MIRALLEMRVAAGRENDFIAAWTEVAKHAARAPGNLRQSLLRDLREPGRFVITTDWASIEDFRAHERSPEQGVVTAPLRALRESAAMACHEVVAAFEGTERVQMAPTAAFRRKRSMIVARIAEGAEERVGGLFAESDRTELPKVAGVRHRSLFVKEDLYLHLIEADADVGDNLETVRNHPLFEEISRALGPYIRPYNPETWQSPADAFAREFYSYDSEPIA